MSTQSHESYGPQMQRLMANTPLAQLQEDVRTISALTHELAASNKELTFDVMAMRLVIQALVQSHPNPQAAHMALIKQMDRVPQNPATRVAIAERLGPVLDTAIAATRLRG